MEKTANLTGGEQNPCCLGSIVKFWGALLQLVLVYFVWSKVKAAQEALNHFFVNHIEMQISFSKGLGKCQLFQSYQYLV